MFKSDAIRQWIIYLAVCLIGTTPLALGQIQTGGIEGTVTDSTGAAVPGTTVTITDVDTASVRQITTDSQGRYSVADLMIGNYQAKVEMQGFAVQIITGLVLAVGQDLVANFKLQVGTVAQQVTVNGTAVQVNTTTTQTGTLVAETQLQQLPLNGRNVEQLIALAPGVAPSQQPTSGGANFGNTPRYSINGGRMDSRGTLLDGVEVRSFWGDTAGFQITGTSLGVASIAELQVITSSANAKYNMPSVVSEVTRSGTNQFHGQAYGYFRNSALDARNYFDPASGPPAFDRYQFGGAVGGPIRKDKTFFFVNYEGIRATQALGNIEVVPDANAHLGIINGVNIGVNSAIAPYLALYPNYGAPGGPALPPGYTDNPATGTATFLAPGQQPQTENYVAGRVDHQFSAANTFSVRAVSDRGSQIDPWFTGNATGAPGFIAYPNAETDPEANLYITLQDRHIFSANVINIGTVAFVRTNQGQQVNLSAVPAPLFAFNSLHEPGQLAVGGIATIPAPTYEPLQQLQNNFTWQDEVDWVHGAHSFAFGGGVTRIQCNCVQNNSAGGAWQFGSLTNFLKNNPSIYNGQFPAVPSLSAYQAGIRYGRQTNISAFFQDNWRVTRRLTLNLGIRDDYITNPTEARNFFYNITHLDPFTCSNNPACDGGVPEAGVSTGFTHTPNMFETNPSTRNIDPRVGFAWDVFGDGKTAFRAAYGIYHSLIFPHLYTVGSGMGYPNGTTQISAPFTSTTGTFPTVNPVSIVPQLRTTPVYDLCCTPYMQEWNATVEQQLPAHLLLSVAYVGGNGIHLFNEQEYNVNIPTAGTQFRPFSPAVAATLPVCKSSSSAYSPSTCAAAQAGFGINGAGYTPNTAFTSVELQTPNGSSNYNSAEVTVSRNLASLQFLSAFTWSRCFDNGSLTTGGAEGGYSTNWVYPHPPRSYNYGLCDFNITKNWTSNMLFPLPFHGNQLKEGWELALIATAHTGNPITATLPLTVDQPNEGQYTQTVQFASVNPNFTGPLYLKQEVHGAAPYARWFDPNAFELGPLGELGNAPRNSINGPNLVDLDLSFLKNTKISKLGEQANLQIRGDFFNVLNHTNFSLPTSTIFNGTTDNVAISPQAGNIYRTSTNSRQLQFSAMFQF